MELKTTREWRDCCADLSPGAGSLFMTEKTLQEWIRNLAADCNEFEDRVDFYKKCRDNLIIEADNTKRECDAAIAELREEISGWNTEFIAACDERDAAIAERDDAVRYKLSADKEVEDARNFAAEMQDQLKAVTAERDRLRAKQVDAETRAEHRADQRDAAIAEQDRALDALRDITNERDRLLARVKELEEDNKFKAEESLRLMTRISDAIARAKRAEAMSVFGPPEKVRVVFNEGVQVDRDGDKVILSIMKPWMELIDKAHDARMRAVEFERDRDAINAKLDAEMATSAALRGHNAEMIDRERIDAQNIMDLRDERDAAIARAEKAEREVNRLYSLDDINKQALAEQERDAAIAAKEKLEALMGTEVDRVSLKLSILSLDANYKMEMARAETAERRIAQLAGLLREVLSVIRPDESEHGYWHNEAGNAFSQVLPRITAALEGVVLS